jgi:hypothetical protein
MNRLNISLLPLVIALTCASPAQAEERADNARMQIAANAEAAAAQPRKEAMQARKEAELARAEASIDVREIRETIRKSIEDANQYGTMISRRSSSDDLVKGNPYSAREVREFKQTLGDGTVISRQSTRLLARDREGRLRQELRQSDGTARIYINDPVAKEVLILNPQKRLACTAGFEKVAIHDCLNQTKGDWKPLGFSFNAGKNGVGMMSANDDLVVEVSPHAQIIDLTQRTLSALRVPLAPIAPIAPIAPTAPVPPVAPVPPAPPMLALPYSRSTPGSAVGSENKTVTREQKTKQIYEGLTVDTDRTIETIAAGSIGNSKAIENVYERYYSPDLKMAVYVRRNDPRNGESLYRMTDIKRSEPDISLFKVPSGYTVTEGKK